MVRRFHSYGPVDLRVHYAVERQELVHACVDHLVGDNVAGGCIFTVWAPRQAGKTWLVRRAAEEVLREHGERFRVGQISGQGMILNENAPPEGVLSYLEAALGATFEIKLKELNTWADLADVFRKRSSLFDRRVLLLFDEFDSLPAAVTDRLVTLFRDIYLSREHYWLHGLGLIGVRAVLGVESARGSPFNVQRSLHVPNLTRAEVEEMFRQYQEESGQEVEPDVPELIFDCTQGQPGLVGWFGELLTEKYNPGKSLPLTRDTFRQVYLRAAHIEPNNTVLNLLKKARGPYRSQVVRLFTNANVAFSFDKDWCNYLYANGVIDAAAVGQPGGEEKLVCRFSSPFVQLRLYLALTDDLAGEKTPILPIEPGDDLADVMTGQTLKVVTLLGRYKGYLGRLKAAGIDPWQGQARRQDLHLTEAVGHFHLYAWLRDAIGHRVSIRPEFPTGNGKVDLLLTTEDNKRAVLEVKSFVDMYELAKGQIQAATYAKKLGLDSATIATFVPVTDDTVLSTLSSEKTIDGVTVYTVAIAWV